MCNSDSGIWNWNQDFRDFHVCGIGIEIESKAKISWCIQIPCKLKMESELNWRDLVQNRNWIKIDFCRIAQHWRIVIIHSKLQDISFIHTWATFYLFSPKSIVNTHIKVMKQLDVVVSPPAFVWDPNLTLTHVTFNLDPCSLVMNFFLVIFS